MLDVAPRLLDYQFAFAQFEHSVHPSRECQRVSDNNERHVLLAIEFHKQFGQLR